MSFYESGYSFTPPEEQIRTDITELFRQANAERLRVRFSASITCSGQTHIQGLNGLYCENFEGDQVFDIHTDLNIPQMMYEVGMQLRAAHAKDTKCRVAPQVSLFLNVQRFQYTAQIILRPVANGQTDFR